MSGESDDVRDKSNNGGGSDGPADTAAAPNNNGNTSSSPLAQEQSKKGWSLPSWLDHFNARDLKILGRCWVACWVASLLMFIHPSLANIGQAAFFAQLVLFIAPPASILFVYLLASLSLLAGMCLAWAWGLLTMKAALAARSDAETLAKLQELGKEATARAKQSGQTVAWEQQVLVHNGFMLDARVTVVYYVMGCVFIYVLARLRCSNPKLTLTQIFGTIVTDLFIIIGPSLPTFNASIGEVLVKPGAIGVGLGAICCLLFFPTSTSYVVLESMGKLATTLEAPLDALRRKLGSEQVPIEHLSGIRAKLIGIYKGMQPAMAFLPLDFSRTRWGASDIKELQEPLRDAMTASLSLLEVHMSWITAAQREDDLRSLNRTFDSEDEVKSSKDSHHGLGRHEALENAYLVEALRSPEQGAMDDEVLKTLRRTTNELLTMCSESVELAARSIKTVNSCRWVRKPKNEIFEQLISELETKLAALTAAQATCVSETTEGVIEAYSDLFGEDGNLKQSFNLGPPALRGIILAMVVEERILNAATALRNLQQKILDLMKKRTTHRIWFPVSLQHGFSWLISGKTSPPIAGASDNPADDPEGPKEDPNSLEDDAKEAYRRLKLSRGYEAASVRSRNKIARGIVATYKWLFNASGMFALRMVIVTLITTIPSVLPRTAGFFYREKGIWGVITAQTSILVYMADFTFSLTIRALATVVGGVLGMLTWYIGSGSGSGNPYGLAAASAVVIPIILWLRIFLPPAFMKATVLLGATFALVVGFSYDQHHLQQYGLPGVGYEAFWKRMVTVWIGFVAAAIVQVLPRPPSANKHVCKSLSSTVRTLSDHYALLLSHWGRGGQRSPLAAVAEEISLSVGESLLGLNEMIALLKFELTTGPYDQEILRNVQTHCQAMNQSLRRLLSLSSNLPQELQDRLAQTFGLLDDRVVGDIMAVLSIIEQSLVTGAPLPERLPTPLVRQFYASWRAQHRNLMLSKTLVRDGNYRRYCVAMSSYMKFLSTIDDMVLLLKRALGECHCVHQWEDA